jgi:hypothetical protein
MSQPAEWDDGSRNDVVTWAAPALTFTVGAICLTAFLVSMIFMGIVFTTRKFTFNLYIIFIMLPDSLLNLVEGLRYVYEGFNDTRNEEGSFAGSDRVHADRSHCRVVCGTARVVSHGRRL